MTLKVIIPTAIAPAMVTSNTLAEVYPAWASGATYALGDRVVSSDGLSVYESLQATNTAHDPLLDDAGAPVWWARFGASNRHALWDGEASLPATASDAIRITLRAGPIGALGLVGMSGIYGLEASLRDLDTGAVVWTRAQDLFAEGIDTPQEFFYSWPRTFKREQAITDVPVYGNAELSLVLTGTSTMQLGELVVGTSYELGDALQDAALGIADYSAQERDRWGRLTLQRGDFSKTPSIPFKFPAARLGKVVSVINRARGRACLFVPSGADWLTPLITLGVLQRMRITLPTFSTYFATLDVEGLAESDAA